MDLSSYNFIIAGYGTPAELVIFKLFEKKVLPQQILILTHKEDLRNLGLHRLAQLRKIKLIVYSKKNLDSVVNELNEFSPHFLFSIHFRLILPVEILNAVKIKSVNLHPSLLPKYRGANSNFWVILNNESETGFTYHLMEESVDAGAIVYQERFPIDRFDTSFSLFHKQIIKGLNAFDEVLEKVIFNHLTFEQEGVPSLFGREIYNGGLIDLHWDLSKIERFIRAMYFPPFKPAHILCNNEFFYFDSINDFLKFRENHFL